MSRTQSCLLVLIAALVIAVAGTSSAALLVDRGQRDSNTCCYATAPMGWGYWSFSNDGGTNAVYGDNIDLPDPSKSYVITGVRVWWVDVLNPGSGSCGQEQTITWPAGMEFGDHWNHLQLWMGPTNVGKTLVMEGTFPTNSDTCSNPDIDVAHHMFYNPDGPYYHHWNFAGNWYKQWRITFTNLNYVATSNKHYEIFVYNASNCAAGVSHPFGRWTGIYDGGDPVPAPWNESIDTELRWINVFTNNIATTPSLTSYGDLTGWGDGKSLLMEVYGYEEGAGGGGVSGSMILIQ